MKAIEYLENIGLEHVVGEEFFNSKDNSWYTVEELMEAYANKSKPDVSWLLNEMIEYVEDADQRIEWEFGKSRTLDEVIKANQMPDIYYKLIALRDKLTSPPTEPHK